jgi:hypothetical protein
MVIFNPVFRKYESKNIYVNKLHSNFNVIAVSLDLHDKEHPWGKAKINE